MVTEVERQENNDYIIRLPFHSSAWLRAGPKSLGVEIQYRPPRPRTSTIPILNVPPASSIPRCPRVERKSALALLVLAANRRMVPLSRLCFSDSPLVSGEDIPLPAAFRLLSILLLVVSPLLSTKLRLPLPTASMASGHYVCDYNLRVCYRHRVL